MQKTKGFTIIELIVVVAIIAVLASIVAVNVVSYLKKGKDAAIKSNLETAQAAIAALVDSTAGIVAGSCGAAGDLKNAFDAAALLSGTGAGKSSCTSVIGAACVCAKLLTLSSDATPVTQYFCVDSTGNKRVTTTDCTAGTCISAAPVCP